MGKNAQRVTRQDIDRVLERVERTCGPDDANQIRAYLVMLEGKLRALQLDSDDVWPVWEGVLE